MVKRDRFAADTISRIVEQRFEGGEVAVFQEATAALEWLRESPATLGLFGLTLTDCDGLDLLATIDAEQLAARRLVITWRTDERTRQALRRLRIDGLVETLRQGPEQLASAVDRALAVAGNRGRGVPRWAPEGGRAGPTLEQILSERELQVFAVLGDGSDDQAAAEALGLSPKTVHTHRQRIMGKLEVQTRAALMQEAMRRGVVRFTETGVLRPGLESILAGQRLRSR